MFISSSSFTCEATTSVAAVSPLLLVLAARCCGDCEGEGEGEGEEDEGNTSSESTLYLMEERKFFK